MMDGLGWTRGAVAVDGWLGHARTFDIKVALGALAMHLDDPVPFCYNGGLRSCALEEAAQQNEACDG